MKPFCVQVKDVMKDVMAGLQQTNSEKILLSWVRQNTRQYPQVGSDFISVLTHISHWRVVYRVPARCGSMLSLPVSLISPPTFQVYFP